MGIGPSTKETTLHHFRDPLLDVVANDEDIDLLGVIVVGTPQDNEDKNFVGTRAAVAIIPDICGLIRISLRGCTLPVATVFFSIVAICACSMR